MALLPLTMIPDPLLRKISLPVGTIDDEIRQFAQDMLDTMYEESGAGLAAVQVGRLLRMATVDIGYRDGEHKPIIAINPEIIASSGEKSSYDEGCLSVGPTGVLSPAPRGSRLLIRTLKARHSRSKQTVFWQLASSTRSII